jgi:RimJ/RimL family protein N-acetyltransferase
VLETARLRLRPWRDDDVEPLSRIYADPEVMLYVGPGTTRTRDQTEAAIERMRSLWARHGFGMWALELASSGQMVGRQGLGLLAETPEVEISYCLARDAWGSGLATESGRAVVRFGFEVAGLDHIAGIAYPPNLPSQRVLAKCGLRYLRDTRYFDADVHYFAITREEWDAEEGRV